jgi:hypothetical protein
MDIIPFLYFILVPIWFNSFNSSPFQNWKRYLRLSCNLFITVHALYLIYNLWQWFSFIKQFLSFKEPINWELVISEPVFKTVIPCLLPLLFFIPVCRKNKYLSIVIWILIGWCYYDRFNFYFFSFHKVALCISIFLIIYAIFWLLDLYKKRT